MLNPLDHPVCFTTPERNCPSAWHEHVPFAMFLVDALKPRVFVELGTHYGRSYCGFCQAVKSLCLGTRCFAIDTWQGDAHAGEYGPEVLSDLRKHHDSALRRFLHPDPGHLRRCGHPVPRRLDRPASHRRFPLLRGRQPRLRDLAAQAERASRRPLPRHQRPRAGLRRLEILERGPGPIPQLRVHPRPRPGSPGRRRDPV